MPKKSKLMRKTIEFLVAPSFSTYRNCFLLVVVLALAWPATTFADGILNGDFQKAGPAGPVPDGTTGWNNGSAAGDDQPMAERDGAGGTFMRLGDNPATTPGPGLRNRGPTASSIAQEFECTGEGKFCNITFQSGYEGAQGELAIVSIITAGVPVTKVIPIPVGFAPHGVSIAGCNLKTIGFAVLDVAGGVDTRSTLYVDNIECTCDDTEGLDDLPNLSALSPGLSSLLKQESNCLAIRDKCRKGGSPSLVKCESAFKECILELSRIYSKRGIKQIQE